MGLPWPGGACDAKGTVRGGGGLAGKGDWHEEGGSVLCQRRAAAYPEDKGIPQSHPDLRGTSGKDADRKPGRIRLSDGPFP